MIAPTIGRIVWYWRLPYEGIGLGAAQPFAAQVAFVHPSGKVNLVVTDHLGAHFAANDVPLVQEGEDSPSTREEGGWCEWIPYQIGQAKK